jgi:cell division protein ZipA
MQLLYAIGIVILLLLIWQAIQWANDYRRRLRLKLEPVPPGADSGVGRNPELGPVRVRPRVNTNLSVQEEKEAAIELLSVLSETGVSTIGTLKAETLKTTPSKTHSPDAALTSTVLPSAVFTGVPVVMSAQEMVKQEVIKEAPVFQENTVAATAHSTRVADDDSVPVLLTPVAPLMQHASSDIEQHDMFAHDPIAPPPQRKKEGANNGNNEMVSAVNHAGVLYEKQVIEPVQPLATPASAENIYANVQDVIALHVVARQGTFNGEDLLRCILGYGLRYGEMAIFHRHEQPTGQGRILFSMAKAVEPGTFDLEAMTGEEIPGVTLFLSLPGTNSIHAYDIMVDTAKRLGVELQGEILDEQQQSLTRQLVEHYRERVQEFERRRLMIRPAR